MHIIPPAVALIVVVAWNLAGWRSVSKEEERKRELGGKIERAKQGQAAAGERAGGRPVRSGGVRTGGGGADAPLDWQALSDRLLEMQDDMGMGDMRDMIQLRNRLEKMTGAELLAAMDEVATTGLDPEAVGLLEEMLVEPLIEKDPELALKSFEDRIGNGEDGVGWQLSGAFEAWAVKNPSAASAWFDRLIADGKFESKTLDGVSESRLEFEAAMVGVLLAENPEAAAVRIAALPEDQRRDALEQIFFSDLNDVARTAYAELVRGLVPEDERAGSFSSAVSELVSDAGYQGVEAFLDKIGATPDERSVSAREAGNTRILEIADERPVTGEDVDAMRAWVERQAPGTSDRVTGEALGDAAQDGGEFDFEDASQLALKYHRSSGNDDVLVAFLDSFAARSNLEQAIELAAEIQDVARREVILKELE